MSERKDSTTFFDLYARGERLADEADDFVDLWHEGDGPDGMSLHEYLGLTWEEYGAWARDPGALPHIRTARESRRPLEAVLAEAAREFRMAARAEDTSELREWAKTHTRSR